MKQKGGGTDDGDDPRAITTPDPDESAGSRSHDAEAAREENRAFDPDRCQQEIEEALRSSDGENEEEKGLDEGEENEPEVRYGLY